MSRDTSPWPRDFDRLKGAVRYRRQELLHLVEFAGHKSEKTRASDELLQARALIETQQSREKTEPPWMREKQAGHEGSQAPTQWHWTRRAVQDEGATALHDATERYT
jgi:hypothetical protein